MYKTHGGAKKAKILSDEETEIAVHAEARSAIAEMKDVTMRIVFVSLFLVSALACGPDQEHAGDPWEVLGRDAEKILGTAERAFEKAGHVYGEMEREGIERWSERVKGLREEIAREVAAAPERRRRDLADLRRELEEIKDGLAAVGAKPPSESVGASERGDRG